MTDEQLRDDLQQALQAAVMRGTSVDEIEAAIEDARDKADRARALED